MAGADIDIYPAQKSAARALVLSINSITSKRNLRRWRMSPFRK